MISELFYRNLIANALDGILLTDEMGKIHFASTSASHILGFEENEIIGKVTFDFVHPDDKELGYHAFMDEVKQQPKVKYISVRLLTKSGDWLWCNVRGHNLMNTPEVKSMAIYFYDDTLRKRAEEALIESEERFRNLIYNISQGVVVRNSKSEVISCNPAALDILGITEEQLIGTDMLDPGWNLVAEDGRSLPDNEHPVSIAFATKKAKRGVIVGVQRPDYRYQSWMLVNADPILDKTGELQNVICTFTDITEQKHLSEKLVEQEIQKQKQLTQATIDGQEKERLEIGKELHDNISQHLTTTRLYLEIARDKASPEVQEMVNLAYKGLSDIINAIRHLSQSLVPATLGDIGLVESVKDICDGLKRSHAFDIDFIYKQFKEEGMPENVKLMLFRIIQEQINNIIRHSGASHFQIKLQSDAEYLMLVIVDNGKGFDLSNFKKGLGLSNIRSRAELFNGKMSIQAEPGKGCTLTVIIPKAIV